MSASWQKLWKACVALCVVSLFAWDMQSGRAQEKTDLAKTALALAPRDAAFFGTTLNLRKSWNDFVEGEFVTRLRAVRYVRSLESDIEREWENPLGPLAQVRASLDNPNVQNLIALVKDMASQEFFIYAGDDWCEAIEGLVEFQNEIMNIVGENPEAQGEFLDNLERTHIDRIRIPTTVIGFRLSEDENARQQLDALEGLLRLGVGQVEEFQPLLRKLRRNDLSDGQTLTLTLDTSFIPVDRLDEEDRATADKVIELLEGRSLTVSLGVKSNILLIAFGEDDTVIDSVGESSEVLLDHESMDVLKQADKTDLRSIKFASKRWLESQWNANFRNYFLRLSRSFSIAIDSESESIPDAEQWKEEIRRDAAWMDERLSELAPRFGDMLAWSRATQGGSEGWMYDWSESVLLENGSPLSILRYAGENSLILMGFKQKETPLSDETVAYAMEIIPHHVRRFISVAEEEGEEREKALQVFDRAWPLVEQAVVILREKIGPALRSSESVITIAGSWTTSEIDQLLPNSEERIPLLEIAVACKLDNRAQFLEGCAEFYELFDESVELIRDLAPDSIPADYAVPRPRQDQLGTATSYYYPELSDSVPLSGFKPQLVVTDDVIILGYSDRQVRDMLEAKALATRPAWWTDETPVAAVSYVDFAGLVNLARPWIKYGLSMTGIPLDEPLVDGVPIPIPSGIDLLQVWDCFTALGKTAGTATVDPTGPTITRWAWVTQ